MNRKDLKIPERRSVTTQEAKEPTTKSTTPTYFLRTMGDGLNYIPELEVTGRSKLGVAKNNINETMNIINFDQ